MRGAIQAELGDKEQAIRSLRQSLELDSGYADAYLHLGKLALAASNAGEAQRCAEKAVTLDPNFAEAWVLLGSVHAACQNHQGAEQCSRKALSLGRDNVPAALLLAQAVAGQGRRMKPLATTSRCWPNSEPDRSPVELAALYGQAGQSSNPKTCTEDSSGKPSA